MFRTTVVIKVGDFLIHKDTGTPVIVQKILLGGGYDIGISSSEGQVFMYHSLRLMKKFFKVNLEYLETLPLLSMEITKREVEILIDAREILLTDVARNVAKARGELLEIQKSIDSSLFEVLDFDRSFEIGKEI